MASDDEGWVSHDSGKPRKPADDEEESIALDSKEYEEWRKGTDDDTYMSDTEYFGGAESGSAPPSAPADSGGGSSSDRNLVIGAAVVLLLLVGSGLFGAYLYFQNADDVASWPTAAGLVSETLYEDGFDEECTDRDDDGYYDDNECTETFWCEIDVSYNFTLANRTYRGSEVVDGEYGESECQSELEGRYVVNGTVTVHYNPDDPDENFIVNGPDAGYAALFCVLPVIVILIIVGLFFQLRSGNFGSGRRWGWGRPGRMFGGRFGHRRSRRGRSPVRRSRSRSTRTRSRKR
ncbi:MAG: hypothetical protein CL960_03445 [Euryarchaeota archaeon]|jgi:hypothetical protein|nr:hypothetical protein [Euryarchaeota archaeon]MDP6363690.1 hypothetical protein [Candidatus Poseidoniia archaeon]MDP6658390.1 hypothetical protein [Candidatus Poseidoniia archaeon]MDP6846059.1 hypothetical protein [Candidatus Poseidoniia archaeon]MDP7006823.1 hypothetical protein [Candidatus Poseidoniia archaeon]|tara:strand:- start:4286 stop:5158 length:873 start_codon:yes stop_codon:yes gene_type:complete